MDLSRLIDALRKKASGVINAGRSPVISPIPTPKPIQTEPQGSNVPVIGRIQQALRTAQLAKISYNREQDSGVVGKRLMSTPIVYPAASTVANFGKSVGEAKTAITDVATRKRSPKLSDLYTVAKPVTYARLVTPAGLAQNTIGGLINTGVNAYQNKKSGRDGSNNYGEAFGKGVDQSVVLSSLSKFNPLFKNQLAKSYTGFPSQYPIAARAGMAAIREGIEGAAQGLLEPIEDGKSRGKNITDQAIFGALFGTGTQFSGDLASLTKSKVWPAIREIFKGDNSKRLEGKFTMNNGRVVPMNKLPSTIDIGMEGQKLRKTRPGSYTNVPEIDNPLIKKTALKSTNDIANIDFTTGEVITGTKQWSGNKSAGIGHEELIPKGKNIDSFIRVERLADKNGVPDLALGHDYDGYLRDVGGLSSEEHLRRGSIAAKKLIDQGVDPKSSVTYDGAKYKSLEELASAGTQKSSLGDSTSQNPTQPQLSPKTPQTQEPQVSTPRGSVSQVSEEARVKFQGAGKKVQDVPSLENIVQQGSDVKTKVNALDYMRTPIKVLEKIGLGREGRLLKQKYDDYLKELPIEINKVTEWAKRASSPDASRRVFRALDGQDVPLNESERAVVGEIRTYLSQWADKLGLPQDKRIANYITHIFDEDFIQKEFDPDIAKLIQEKVPGSVYDPFLEKRLGALGYKEDAWQALDAYIKRGVRKFHMDQALKPLKLAAESLDTDSYKYVERLGARINLRPTELDNLVDNTIKSFVGYKYGARPTARITRGIRQAVYRGTLGLNIGSAMKNLTQGVNTYSELGEKYLVKGYMDLTTNWKSGELERVGVLRDDFIQDRSLNATKKFWQNLDKGLFSLFEMAEKINRGSAYYGAKAKYLRDGLPEDQAIKKAVQLVEKTQFRFGSVDTPVALQSDMAKFFTQFQSFNVKQAEFLGEKIKNREIAGMVRYALASLVVAKTVGTVTGTELTDFIPFSGVATGDTKLGETPAIRAGGEIVKAVTNAPDKYGQERSTGQKLLDVGNSLVPLVPGGVQARKTIGGVMDVARGYKPTKTGNIRYPIKQSPRNFVQAATMGGSNLPEAKEYYDQVDEKNNEDKIVNSLKEGKVNLNTNNPVMSANAVYRYTNSFPVKERQDAYNKIKESLTPEIKKELKAIMELEAQGLNRKDRDLTIIPEEIRARSIYERIMDLSVENRQKKYDELLEMGIITPTIKEEIKRIMKEKK